MILLLVTLLLSPWHGPSLPTASAAAAKYRLSVNGAPRERIALRARGLPPGWIASFCTQSFCSPMRYTLGLDGRGRGVVEFQLIRISGSAPRHVQVRIFSRGAAPVSVRV